MAITNSDIVFFRSGDFGLGGEISAVQLEDRLFKDVPAEEVASGTSDYMCLYIKNNNQNDSMYRFGINATDYNYSDVQIGFPGTTRCVDTGCPDIFKFSREKQKIIFVYKQDIFGEFRLFVDSFPINISWYPNSILDPNSNSYLPCQIKRGLSELFSHSCNDVCAVGCQLDIDVTIDDGYPVCNSSTIPDTTQNGCTLSITIEYPAGKQYDLMKLEKPNDFFLYPEYIFNNGYFSFSASRISYGGPINSTAKSISNTKVAPQDSNGFEITFFNNSETVVLEELKAGEYIPVWVKRLIPSGSSNVLDDGFVFNISAYNTLETTQPPTTTPFVLVDDQKQEIFSEFITTEIDKNYWQVFKAGYTGKLRVIQLGFYGLSDSQAGSGHLRVYKDATPQVFNVIYSSPISVSIQPNGITWNLYSLNIDVEKDKEYTIGYFPKFSHRLPLNGNNVYLNGYFGIDSIPNPNKDMLFRTQIFTNMVQ